VKSFKWQKNQIKAFWGWINERHRIYLNRKAGDKWPWTKDKILREFKFTNVYRQLDRVTQEWTKRYVTLLDKGRNLEDEDILFQCAQFRLFNWPETYDALFYGLRRWDMAKAIDLLTKRQEEGKQIFTGAYIIPNAGRTDPKIQVICEALEAMHKERRKLTRKIKKYASMERAVELLQAYPTIGGFIGYEIACDLRHTRVLSHARDVNSWANPGPGARRGIHRLLTGDRHYSGKKPDYIAAMRQLLVEARPAIASESALGKHVFLCDWPFEMREIEHSLCEFDKYMRVKNGEGRPRSIYRPVLQEELPWND
jgi:hypothetical protein